MSVCVSERVNEQASECTRERENKRTSVYVTRVFLYYRISI
jgi:hypothetical protein